MTMWVVRAGDELYVRSAYGPNNPWYRRATETRRAIAWPIWAVAACCLMAVIAAVLAVILVATVPGEDRAEAIREVAGVPRALLPLGDRAPRPGPRPWSAGAATSAGPAAGMGARRADGRPQATGGPGRDGRRLAAGRT